MDFSDVFHLIAARAALGEPSVLVTVCSVEGSSMRNPGALMAVAQDGQFAGSLSGGCIENAVVAEALEALALNQPRCVRFGAGSDYIDIKLPCGGGLDVHFQLLDASSALASQCLDHIEARDPITLAFDGSTTALINGWQLPQFDPQSGHWRFGYWPSPRLQIIGHGEGVGALARLALASRCVVDVLSPDDRVLADLPEGATAQRLGKTSDTHLLSSDRWSAFVFLFHDHDWEADLMAQAFGMPHFYIGAMGGRRAHAIRQESLRQLGISQAQISTMRAPIGLFHSSRDPQTLALSTLAEVIHAYEAADFEADLG